MATLAQKRAMANKPAKKNKRKAGTVTQAQKDAMARRKK